MEKYIKLKEKCDASYCDMGETERLLKAIVKKMDEAYQSGSLRELKNVLPALQRLESRAKGSYSVAGYSKRDMEKEQDGQEMDRGFEYWRVNCDLYLWRMEVALQSMWWRTINLKQICAEWLDKHPDAQESMFTITVDISEACLHLENAAVKWKEANALWLELFDSDHAVRNSSNPNMTIWRGQYMDYRRDCAEEAMERHIYMLANALPEYKEKYFLSYASEMTEKLRNY